MSEVLVISARDNVATALEVLASGAVISVDGTPLTVRDVIPAGHKVAISFIAKGTAVVKYGSAIGLASTDIPAGAHVHVQNVASQRGRGDLTPRCEPTRSPSFQTRENPDD